MFNGSADPFSTLAERAVRYATITLPKSQLAARHELVAGIPRKSRTKKKVRTMTPKKRRSTGRMIKPDWFWINKPRFPVRVSRCGRVRRCA